MKKLLTFVLLLSVQLAVLAAPITPPPPPGGAPPGAPIPGILIALVAAMGYGVYKKFNNQKK